VIISSPWDYPVRAAEFLTWLDRVASVVPVLNTPAVIRWNIDKVYLRDIAAVSGLGSARLVVKPSVSAGSQNTGLFDSGDAAAIELAAHILDIGKTVMVQPAIEGVQERGEHALLYFDGRFSHATSKGPLLAVGGGLLGGAYAETIESIDAHPAERAIGDALISAATRMLVRQGLSDLDALPL
jgi:hypothetical protein